MEHPHGYAQAAAQDEAFDPESGAQAAGGPSSSRTRREIEARTISAELPGFSDWRAPIRARGDAPASGGGGEERVEYRLPPCLRLAAFLGFLLAGAVGVVLGFGALMLPMLLDSPNRTAFDNLFIFGFAVGYLALVAGLLLLASMLLSAACSGVLVVWWRCDGRVPCPGGLGLGDLFSCLR